LPFLETFLKIIYLKITAKIFAEPASGGLRGVGGIESS